MDLLAWLLDADPSIRWQVLRDLADAPEEQIAAERVRVAHEGWGGALLDLQGADGQWAGGACFPGSRASLDEPEPAGEDGQPWTSTYPTLLELVSLGVDPKDPRVRAAIEGVRHGSRWEHDDQPFFDGEVEPCINGQTVLIGTYFGVPVDGIVERLLTEQLDDGGWNCEAERGSVRSSFHSTICVVEGLLAYERANSGPAAVSAARAVAEEYLLTRRLMYRRSTGQIVEPSWLQFSFPTRWYYDVLRGLDHFRELGGSVDPRLTEAVDHLRSKRQSDGRWLLENTHPGASNLVMERDGEPSRWITLRALRVIDWVEGSAA